MHENRFKSLSPGLKYIDQTYMSSDLEGLISKCVFIHTIFHLAASIFSNVAVMSNYFIPPLSNRILPLLIAPLELLNNKVH